MQIINFVSDILQKRIRSKLKVDFLISIYFTAVYYKCNLDSVKNKATIFFVNFKKILVKLSWSGLILLYRAVLIRIRIWKRCSHTTLNLMAMCKEKCALLDCDLEQLLKERS